MAVIKVRKTNKGEKRYQATIRIKGYKPLWKTFNTRPAAEKWAKIIEGQMKEGTYKEFVDNDFNIESMTELIDYFDKEVAKKRYSHYEKYNVMYEWWKAQIGYIKVRELSSAQLTICKNKLQNEKIIKKKNEVTRSANTINKYLMALSAILTYAVNELEIIDTNPMSKVKLLEKPNSRTRFLADNEIYLLGNTCKEYSDIVFVFWILLFKTGGRFNEVRHLQVKDIDRNNKRVYFLDTKNHTHRSVYIGDDALNIIDEYLLKHNIESGYIFRADRQGAELATLKGAMEYCIKTAGIKDFRIHDIRHTTASILAQSGASLLEIAEILGQKSLTVARLYSHLTKKHTEKVLASVMDKYKFN